MLGLFYILILPFAIIAIILIIAYYDYS